MKSRPRAPRLPPSDLDFIPQEEAMRRLSVSRQTLYRWRREGRVRSIENFGRVRISAESLRALTGKP